MQTTPTRLDSVVTDSQRVPLDRLAADPGRAAAKSLGHVLPGADQGRVPVAAFGSCI